MGLQGLRGEGDVVHNAIRATDTCLPETKKPSNKPYKKGERMNTITIVGKVGQDPELRATNNGKMICTFSVATTSGKDDKKKTVWHNVTAFGDLGEHCAESFSKGSNVIVVGKFDVDEYETKTGEKRKTHKIIADEAGLSIRWAGATSNDPSKWDRKVQKAVASVGAEEDF